jgi:chromate transport protein ChrA
MPALQSDLSKYFMYLKSGITKGGGGPASLPFLKAITIEKLKEIHKCLE